MRQEDHGDDRRKGRQGEIQVGAHVAHVIDRNPRQYRPQQVGGGHDQRIGVEVVGARRPAAERADQRLHGDLHQYEAGAGHRGGDEQHRQSRPEIRQDNSQQRNDGTGDDRDARSVAVGDPAGEYRQQQRKYAVGGKQQPGIEGAAAQFQRVERVGHARALVAGVPQQNDRENLEKTEGSVRR